MTLLSEFRTSVARVLDCGCDEDRQECLCGAPAGHGGIPIGESGHGFSCRVHPGARMVRP